MKLVGLDLNATRVRALHGTAGSPPRLLALDGAHADLPMALSLEGRHPDVGRAGLALCRRLPHLACLNILAYLGERHEWSAGRHRLDAARAMALVFERLQPSLAGAKALALTLPAYLTPAQVGLLAPLTEKLRVPVLGSVAAPLAAALAAYLEQPWEGPALVVDADDHALSLAVVVAEDDQARVVGERSLSGLGLRAWKECLLNAVADRCVRHSRRDPRDSAPAEQSLYDQLGPALEAWRQGQLVELVIRAAPWFQNLLLRPEEAAAFVGRLVRHAAEAVRGVVRAAGLEAPRFVLLTEAAARLPGLAGQLHSQVEEGLALLRAEAADSTVRGGPGAVVALPGEALARAAWELAVRVQRGELSHGHFDAVLPLPPRTPADAGPPRLHFRGQDHVLRGTTFVLGRQPGCDLVLDSELYPMVSARHCEIVLDHRSYLLRDRSRNGTLLNDRPVSQQAPLRAGDWIRLGPDGPLLRFLGQADDQRKLGTIA